MRRLLLAPPALLAALLDLRPAGPPARPPVPAGARIGHRAGLADAPENSLEAIRRAAVHGADGVELDVRWSSDGRPICAHDPGQPGPSLADALDLALDRGLRVELDVKTGPLGDRALVGAIVEAIALRDARDRVWVTAFQPVAAWQVRRADPGVALGVPLRFVPWDGPARWLGASVLEPHRRLATPERIERWQRRGWRVEVWTVPAEEEQRLRELGAAVVVDSLGIR